MPGDEINWDDPTQRAALAERVGPERYNALHAEHVARSSLAVVNGYRIRPINTQFGRLFQIVGTTRAEPTLERAKTYAASLEPGGG